MSAIDLKSVEQKCAQHFAVLAFAFRGELSLTIRKDDLLAILRFVKDDAELQFNYLVDISGTDTRPLNGSYTLAYHLHSQANKLRLRLKVLLDPADLHIESATQVWPGSNFQEREIYDLLGIIFAHHPNPTRLYLPEDFVGHPLRKEDRKSVV